MRKSAAAGARILREIADQLEDGTSLESSYAQLLLEQASQNAASRPTPQSAMAADALYVSGNVIRSAGGASEDVALGSEFGSDIYPQFHHSHTSQGLWLYPAAEDEGVLQNMDDELEKLMDDVIDGAF